LGVALVLVPPVALEVQGLRRALGDGSLDRAPPHLTLVPPVNVRSDALEEALAVLRAAASGPHGALELDLGPAATFLPVNPVVFLDVSGPGLDALARLHRAVSSGPLLRAERWPWHPHVTLCDEAPLERAAAAVGALAEYRARASFDRVVLLEERDRRWLPLADARLGPRVVVGRGGLELEITEGGLLGPDVRAMLGRHPGTQAGTQAGPTVVLTGRREGVVVGVAVAWAEPAPGGPAHVCVLVEEASRGQGVGRALVLALEASLRRQGWAMERVQGHGPPAFFAHCCAWSRDFAPAG
jgi:2'-5' RNA ligase